MSAISEVDVRDWERAEKIVKQLPILNESGYVSWSGSLPSWEDWCLLKTLIDKQIASFPQISALFKEKND